MRLSKREVLPPNSCYKHATVSRSRSSTAIAGVYELAEVVSSRITVSNLARSLKVDSMIALMACLSLLLAHRAIFT